MNYIQPEWPAPAGVRAVSTLRHGGVSPPPFDSFNLAAHVGDDPKHVSANRERLRRELQLPGEPHWLSQLHGTRVIEIDPGTAEPEADAAWTDVPGRICAVLTADCLPVLLATRDGRRVAAAHAGWRGLAAGILEATVRALGVPGEKLVAWIGPAIEREHFEVGIEVREALLPGHQQAEQAFVRLDSGKWLADLHLLARQRLERIGLHYVSGGNPGTYRERERFFSYRRDGRCGRMATLVWIE